MPEMAAEGQLGFIGGQRKGSQVPHVVGGPDENTGFRGALRRSKKGDEQKGEEQT